MAVSLKNEQKLSQTQTNQGSVNPLNKNFTQKGKKVSTEIKKTTQAKGDQYIYDDSLDLMQEEVKIKFNDFIKKIIEFLAKLISDILQTLTFGLARRYQNKKKEKEIIKKTKVLQKK